jgi:hypothetical protein
MKRFLVFVFTLVGLSGWQAEATVGPGCDTSRQAEAFNSTGTGDTDYSIISPAPEVVRPCANMTGFGGAESRVAVAPNGDVLQTPAIVGRGLLGTPVPAGHLPGAPKPEFVFTQNAGIGWSQDGGASWQLIKANGNLGPQGDNDLYIDHDTGRLYYSMIFGALPTPANDYSLFYTPHGQLLTSPADPAGYTRWYSNDMWGWLSENPRFTTAPAPAGQPQPVPGEKMSYWCANFVNALAAVDRTCHRSFDGGASWEFASIIGSTPPQHSECGTNGESTGYPQGDQTDGSLWLTVSCGGNNYLARSTDEATTWPLVQSDAGGLLTLPAAGQLRVDTAGNLYLFSSGLVLRTSTDGGQIWTAPVSMVAPEARGKTLAQTGVAIGYEPGQAAVVYQVPRGSAAYPADGYITVTKTALDANPVFYAASINDPSGAPMRSYGGLSDDFTTLDVGPDGTPWAGFWSDCHKDANGNYIEGYCKYTGGTRVVPFVPPVDSTVSNMTMGSLEWE